MSTQKLFVIQPLTLLSPGAGSSPGLLDLPVQREPHTRWPYIPGTSLKGVLRSRLREHVFEADQLDNLGIADGHHAVTAIFGPPSQSAADHAGSLIVRDAMLLAFPVRRGDGDYALLTCPGALNRFARVAGLTDLPALPSPQEDEVLQTTDTPANGNPLYLEEFPFTAKSSKPFSNVLDSILAFLGEQAGPDHRWLMVNDVVFTYFTLHATVAVIRNALNYQTKTVQDKKLFHEEMIPPYSLLYSLLTAHPTRNGGGNRLSAETVIENIATALAGRPVQIGAGATTGAGLCDTWLRPIDTPAAASCNE